MIGKLLPLLLGIFGVAAGVGAGTVLGPSKKDAQAMHDCAATTKDGDVAKKDGAKEKSDTLDCAETAEKDAPEAKDKKAKKGKKGKSDSVYDYVKLNNQFVIPVVEDDTVISLVVVSISLEVKSGETEAIYLMEPKIRDALLQVMFQHANAGGFRGVFTQTNSMILLRDALREVAIKTGGARIHDVLITDLVRQDV